MNLLSDSIQKQLHTTVTLSSEHIEFYRKNQFIKLKKIFNEETIRYFNDAISMQVNAMNVDHRALEERSTYGRAFLQLFNLWRENTVIRELVFSKRIAKIAADLMQVNGVRLYHDQALFKENGGGITPWHADQYYWPLSSDKTITIWIPLHEVPLEMGPLEFSAGSHKIIECRDLEISDESEYTIQNRLKITDFLHVIEPFDLGEVSFHSGWIFHRAGANSTNEIRKVMTIIYMDEDMLLKHPENINQENDWKTWCPGAKIGNVINTPLNPQIYSRSKI